MRPRVLAVLLALSIGVAGALAATGSARSTMPGDGCLVVEQGYGKVTIMLTRGVILGRFQSGTITYSDQDATDGVVNLPRVPQVPATKVGDHTWVYGPAADVRFRASGPTKLTINAQYMSLSAAGKGYTRLSVAGFSPDIAGKFSVDDESFCAAGFQKMPLLPTRFPIASPVAG
jgi:hypothetical protein